MSFLQLIKCLPIFTASTGRISPQLFGVPMQLLLSWSWQGVAALATSVREHATSCFKPMPYSDSYFEVPSYWLDRLNLSVDVSSLKHLTSTLFLVRATRYINKLSHTSIWQVLVNLICYTCICLDWWWANHAIRGAISYLHVKALHTQTGLSPISCRTGTCRAISFTVSVGEVNFANGMCQD